jgi:hypothetical protein
MPADLAFVVGRVTGIEPALSACEPDRPGPLTALTWARDVPPVTRHDPCLSLEVSATARLHPNRRGDVTESPTGRPRGRKPKYTAAERENMALRRENEKLKKELTAAHMVVHSLRLSHRRGKRRSGEWPSMRW